MYLRTAVKYWRLPRRREVKFDTCTLPIFLQAPKRGVKAPVPAKKKPEKVTNPLFEKKPKQFGIRGALPPKKDLHCFVKWPKVVRIQRQRRILKQWLKAPPALNQFTHTLDKNVGIHLVHSQPLNQAIIGRICDGC
ncbi:unnamed protein product [Miscanthus lutarioriparius]|uniref:60S ribosomal protein L7a n=1 Tax=Miscanthus lutarioriparius TaxID=422564 RepID=A0A811SCD8_9POAL|nr:unnamed protein product [Miscanthus lutarioriparius]